MGMSTMLNCEYVYSLDFLGHGTGDEDPYPYPYTYLLEERDAGQPSRPHHITRGGIRRSW